MMMAVNVEDDWLLCIEVEEAAPLSLYSRRLRLEVSRNGMDCIVLSFEDFSFVPFRFSHQLDLKGENGCVVVLEERNKKLDKYILHICVMFVAKDKSLSSKTARVISTTERVANMFRARYVLIGVCSLHSMISFTPRLHSPSSSRSTTNSETPQINSYKSNHYRSPTMRFFI